MNEYNGKEIFAKNLNRYLEESRKSQIDVAKYLNISTSTFSSWCTGSKMPRMDKIEMLASYFGIRKSDLIEDKSKVIGEPYHPTHRIPILGYISAGLPLYAEEHIEGYTMTDLNGDEEYFALRVSGDSMTAARIAEGDILIVRRQPCVENGEIAVVIVGNENATVKRFRQDGNMVTLMPQSFSPDHHPQVYNLKDADIKIIGKVVRNEINF